MANCSTYTLGGIQTECLATNGGVKNIYFILHDAVTVPEGGFTIDETHSIKVDALKTAIGDSKFLAYHFAKHQASLTTVSAESNGSKYWQSTLAMQFNRMEGKKHLEIQALANSELDALVEDYNGKVWFIGNDGYLSETSGNTTAQTGTAIDDLNGYNISLVAKMGTLPIEVKGDLAAIVAETVGA